MRPCENETETLGVNGLIYQVGQDILAADLCGELCERVVYKNIVIRYAEATLGKELAQYGEKGYFVTWMYYSSLYVKERTETFTFDFDTALVAVGGSLGLFLGWSLNSMLMFILENLYDKVWLQYYASKLGPEEKERRYIKKSAHPDQYPTPPWMQIQNDMKKF